MTVETSLARDHPEPLERFFAFARERHRIHLARQAGAPQPWTDDPILAHYRFTNVFRELDATTKWCKKYVRDPLGDRPEVLLAVVLFRWFNRVSTGEAIFYQPHMLTKKTLFEQAAEVLASGASTGGVRLLLHGALRKLPPPYVTGAYTINTAGLGNGKSKLEGVLLQFQEFCKRDWRTRAQQMATPAFHHTMEGTCIWLEESPGMGGFMAYEVACDLRYTPLLQHAADVCTWANPGPGAQRGLQRVARGRTAAVDVRKPLNKEVAVADMRVLLEHSRAPGYWPKEWPAWEMREVEHTLCEFDKYERARLGQGRPRGVFSRG